MKNVYDLIDEKGLEYIIPLHYSVVEQSTKTRKVAVILHLHYYNDVKRYFSFLCNIPEMIDIYVTYSDVEVKNKMEECLNTYHVNIKYIQKENRGRDVSALLVACREIVLAYDYVCFLHDKKEKSIEEKEFIDKWIRDLWENLLGSSDYIQNIINLFDNHPQLGLLVPPKPRAHEQEGFYINEWYGNYENTCKLANEMKLNCDLDKEKPPIALGTAFWCRVEALKKLFLRPWEYSDFHDEPLPNDGTISHVIERIFPYVIQDAGFDTALVLNDQIALQKMKDMTNNIQKTYRALEKYGVCSMTHLNKIEASYSLLIEVVKKYKQIYLYGAGKYGKICLNILKAMNIIPTGFVVSQKGKEESYEGIDIFELSEIDLNKEVGIIISVGQKNAVECIKNIELKDKNFRNYIVF